MSHTSTSQASYWKGSSDWGENLACADGEVLIGACTSGGGEDCALDTTNDKVCHAIQCESLEEASHFEKTFAGLSDQIVITDWESSENFDVSCGNDSFAAGLCSGGANIDCTNSNSGQAVRTRLYCAEASSGSSNINVETGTKVLCGHWGERLSCPDNMAIQSACSSGRNDDCEGQYGCASDTYTALLCAELEIIAPTPSPVAGSPTTQPSASCTEESYEVLKEVDGSYDDTGATITVLSDGNNTWTELVDFSTNTGNNAVYKSACEGTSNSLYVEFTYKLMCTSGDDTLDVLVSQHPRCVADVCSHLDYTELLEEDVVKLTVERNDNTWDCTGEFIDEIPTACSYQTDLMSTDTDIIYAKGALTEPSIGEQKFLFITVSDGILVTYDYADYSMAALETACANAGGHVEFASTVITCGNDDAVESTIYDVMNYPACLGATCVDDISSNSWVIAAQFQESMVELDQMKSSMECSITGDLSLGAQDEESFLEKYWIWLAALAGLVLVCVIIGLIQSRAGGEQK